MNKYFGWIRIAAISVGLGALAFALYVIVFWSGAVVEVVRAQEREVVELLVATGRLEVQPVSDLAMDVSGIVESVHVRQGDRVEAGQALVELRQDEAGQRAQAARLAARTARRELGRARAGAPEEQIAGARAERERVRIARDLAQRELSRSEQLYSDGLMTAAQLEAARGQFAQSVAAERSAQASLDLLESLPRSEDVAVARARLQEAEAAAVLAQGDVERRVLSAPFSGLVLQRTVEPGEAVASGAPLIRLANMGEAEIRVETDENNLAQIRRGQRATAIVSARPEQRFDARVSQIGPEVDAERGVVEVRLTPRALPAEVFPDMTVDVNIELLRLDAALSLPRSAVAEDQQGAYVMIVTEGRAHRRGVQVLARGADWMAVGGLADDEQVVLRIIDVEEGQSVRAQEVEGVL
ncbi:MAG: efflux RND transporter periplasmic adaptor subunit [Bradymonadaceae bacterium]|nr:efflux RND transporter periplasmic adaptor subunit [Lujinxingiaceae bacterium]